MPPWRTPEMTVGSKKWPLRPPGWKRLPPASNLPPSADHGRDLLFELGDGVGGDQRAHVGLAVHRIADLQRLDVLDHALDEFLRDRLDHIDALRRGADLPGVQQPRPHRAGHCHVEIGVVEHDQRVDAAELEIDLLQLRSGRPTAMCLPTAVEPVNAIMSTSG